MKFRIAILIAAFAALSAYAADETMAPKAPESMQKVTFCNLPYALCIKAPCARASSANTDVNCVCDVIVGWSMGPQSCDQRKPVVSDGKTHLISTYANYYN